MTKCCVFGTEPQLLLFSSFWLLFERKDRERRRRRRRRWQSKAKSLINSPLCTSFDYRLVQQKQKQQRRTALKHLQLGIFSASGGSRGRGRIETDALTTALLIGMMQMSKLPCVCLSVFLPVAVHDYEIRKKGCNKATSLSLG